MVQLLKQYWWVLALIALAIVLYLIFGRSKPRCCDGKPIKSDGKCNDGKQPVSKCPAPPGGSGGGGNGNILLPDSRIGKNAWSDLSSKSVFNSDWSLYKTAAKGEWLGKIYGVDGIWFEVSGNRFTAIAGSKLS